MTKKMISRHEGIRLDELTIDEAIEVLSEVRGRLGGGATIDIEYDGLGVSIDYKSEETDSEQKRRLAISAKRAQDIEDREREQLTRLLGKYGVEDA